MEVSKLTLSDELTHQTSSLTKALLWMEQHPKQCQNTNIRKIAKTISLDKDRPLRMTTFSTEQLIYQLMRRGWITRNGNRFNSDFVINYGHPDLPKELENQHITTTKFSVKENVNKRNAEIVKKNGGTLKEIILKWMQDNPDKLSKVRLHDLANLITKDTKVYARPDSVYAIMGRMVKEGTIKRTRSDDDWLFNFEVPAGAKIEYKPVGGDVKKAVVAANGGTLEENIIRWMAENPDKLTNTNARILTKQMIKDLNIKTTFESLYTQFRKMYSKKNIIVRTQGDNGWCNFRLAKTHAPKEEKPSFKELVQEGVDPIQASILTEDRKENKVEEQTVNLPEGKTIHLVININFGK